AAEIGLVGVAPAMRALSADAADARIVLSAEVALGGFATAPANLGVEPGAVALADGRAALRADLAVELAAVFLARSGATPLGGFGAGLGAGLAARWLLRRLALELLLSHGEPLLRTLRRQGLPRGSRLGQRPSNPCARHIVVIGYGAQATRAP